jgi:hypothetical protein
MNLGTHMPDGERRKPIDIEVCRSKVKFTFISTMQREIYMKYDGSTEFSSTKLHVLKRNILR